MDLRERKDGGVERSRGKGGFNQVALYEIRKSKRGEEEGETEGKRKKNTYVQMSELTKRHCYLSRRFYVSFVHLESIICNPSLLSPGSRMIVSDL